MPSQTAQNSKSTQEFVPIKEVRDGVVVLKDGGLRLILIASSLNLALKSEDEQRATISQFQNFLNSLDFSVQIYVSSRRLDIRPYIALLEERLKAQMEDLLKIQIREYIDFVKNFTERSSIMTKNFFIVVPYTQPLLGGKRAFQYYCPAKKEPRKKSLTTWRPLKKRVPSLNKERAWWSRDSPAWASALSSSARKRWWNFSIRYLIRAKRSCRWQAGIIKN